MSTPTWRNSSSPHPKQAQQQQQHHEAMTLPHGGGAVGALSPSAGSTTTLTPIRPPPSKRSKLLVERNNPSRLNMICLVVCLIGTQMAMLIATKQVMAVAPLPLLLCEAQFLVSCLSARGLMFAQQLWSKSIHNKNGNGKSDTEISQSSSFERKTSWTFYLPLSLSWTFGFVLFNASATYMSPSYVNLMRCGEPLATVLVGFILFGKRYAGRVLITLVPVLGGVWLASPSRNSNNNTVQALSGEGIVLAGLSNVCFCIRPFVLHAMKQKQNQKQNSGSMNKAKQQSTSFPSVGGSTKNPPPIQEQDDLHTFLLVTTLAAFAILPGLVWMLEGHRVRLYAASLVSKLMQERDFSISLLGACLGFFTYQFTQLRVMSLTTPLAFSILTPVIKAVMIVLCSLYFGDPLGLRQVCGVLMTTSGGYWFSKTKLAINAGSTGGSSTGSTASSIGNGSGQRKIGDASILPLRRQHVHHL